MKKVRAEDALGKPLAHDVVQYGPKLKTVLFKRGHVVRAEDIERLKNSGNYFVHVEEGEPEGVHEDEAALRMAKVLTSKHMLSTRPNKGRVNLLAQVPGLLKVKTEVIKQINLLDDFIIATRPDNSGVRRGQILASVKIVPLSIGEARMREVEEILSDNKPVLRVVPPKIKMVGAIVTGTEIHEGRVKDAFLPVLQKKLAEYGVDIAESFVVPDDEEKIKRKILELKERGHELILVCGGMAVDAGDVTPNAIKSAGAEVIFHGAPVFPGAMLMLAYLKGVPVLGLPACVIPDEKTSFDLILPRLLVNERIERKDVARLGHGGLL
jgi:molybdopterin biosynthesis enzyme